MKTSFNLLQHTSREAPIIARYIFTGILAFTIFQKVYDPAQFANLSRTLGLFFGHTSRTPARGIKAVYWSIILTEIFIVFGFYSRPLFPYSVFLSFLLLGTGSLISLISLYFGLHSACGCGLFGENPGLVLAQKFILLGFLFYIQKNKRIFFPSSDRNFPKTGEFVR